MAEKKSLKEIKRLDERNRRVEADKAWETSKARRLIIAVFTYVTISIFLFYIKAPDPFIVSIVPTIGYLLSTLTMPILKRAWLNKVYRRSPR